MELNSPSADNSPNGSNFPTVVAGDRYILCNLTGRACNLRFRYETNHVGDYLASYYREPGERGNTGNAVLQQAIIDSVTFIADEDSDADLFTQYAIALQDKICTVFCPQHLIALERSKAQ